MPPAHSYVPMKCDTCGRVRDRYPNAKFCYNANGKICGRLRRVSAKVCPHCKRPYETLGGK